MNKSAALRKVAFDVFGWGRQRQIQPGDEARLNEILNQHGIPNHTAKEILERQMRQGEQAMKVPDRPQKLKGFFGRHYGKMGLGAAGMLGAYGVYKMMQPAQPSPEEMAQMQQQGGF